MSQLIGQTVGQYEVVERIGSGGMGEVYLARDTSLDRRAALKFLPQDLIDDAPARSRLLREARAAAALDHPYICKVYSISEFEGQLYLALEFIEGKTLQRELRGGLLPLSRVLTIATQLCEALEEAHLKGIVHRDLKPSNLMFGKQGHLKVLDFGLAKRHDLSAESDVPLTATGMAIGTIPYMSPEQLNGEDLGPRSDLFSVGILLYEMLAGVHPFGRKVNMETAMAILNKPAPPMHRVGEPIPAHLIGITKRLLSKSAADRYANARKVREALEQRTVDDASQEQDSLNEAATVQTRRPLQGVEGRDSTNAVPAAGESASAAAGSSAASSPLAIAVLPFARLSPDPEDEYFGDGLADEITSSLARLRAIRVVARTSAFAFKDRNEDVRIIGKELGADTLLQGSIRRSGKRVRIGVQLVTATDGSHLWSESFDRELIDVFAVQDEIAQSVVGTLRLQLGSGSMRAIAVPRTHSMEAYELYLQAGHNMRAYTMQSFQQALRCYEDALKLDPDFAPALIGSAQAYVLFTFFGVVPAAVGYPKALELAERAIEADPNVDSGRSAIATIKAYWQWDFANAERELMAQIQAMPNHATAYYTLSALVTAAGRFPEALELAKEACRIDPLNSTITAQVGYVHYFALEFEKAEKELRAVAEKHPADAMPALGLAVTLRELGRPQDALDVLDASPTILGVAGEATKATCYALLGRELDARSALEGLESAATDALQMGYLRAAVHVALGEHDRAIDLLEVAAELKESMIIHVGVQPHFKALVGDARFDALLARMGLSL